MSEFLTNWPTYFAMIVFWISAGAFYVVVYVWPVMFVGLAIACTIVGPKRVGTWLDGKDYMLQTKTTLSYCCANTSRDFRYSSNLI